MCGRSGHEFLRLVHPDDQNHSVAHLADDTHVRHSIDWRSVHDDVVEAFAQRVKCSAGARRTEDLRRVRLARVPHAQKEQVRDRGRTAQ